MAGVRVVDSFGASFGVPAGSSTNWYGYAENRLKRVGEKIFKL